MNTITAILQPDADGTLHLPLPPELRHVKIKVEAKLEAAGADGGAANLTHSEGKPKRQKPIATPEMIQQRMAALARLRELNPYREISDPVAWQREIREERPLPGRE